MLPDPLSLPEPLPLPDPLEDELDSDELDPEELDPLDELEGLLFLLLGDDLLLFTGYYLATDFY